MTKQQLTKEEVEQLQALIEHNRRQVDAAGGDQNFAEGIIVCSHEELAVFDVFVDETMMLEVEPVEHYGYENIKEMIKKWKE